MSRQEAIARYREFVAAGIEVLVEYLEDHPNEPLQTLCKDADPDNWNALRVRVQRAQAARKAASQTDAARTRADSLSSAERHAKSSLRNPEQRKRVMASLPSEQIEEVIQEAHSVVMDRLHAKQAERDTTPKQPTTGDLMGGEQFDPSESWADADIIRVREKAHALRRQVEKWGLVLGSMDEEQAFAYLQEAERNIAEVRVALQERMADRSRAEV